MPSFACTECGSPEIRLPPELTPQAPVCCGGCGRRFATWNGFQRMVSQVVQQDREALPSCDRPLT